MVFLGGEIGLGFLGNHRVARLAASPTWCWKWKAPDSSAQSPPVIGTEKASNASTDFHEQTPLKIVADHGRQNMHKACASISGCA
jgi:hypothetical protein